jgi:CRISPR/Cas system type I-B associated protein Csh2 (Cas7 group RAMP superfamily)
VFDEVINFIESEKIGFTKEDIKNAKEKIDK